MNLVSLLVTTARDANSTTITFSTRFLSLSEGNPSFPMQTTFSNECLFPAGLFISYNFAFISTDPNVCAISHVFRTSLADRLLRRMGWKSDEVAAMLRDEENDVDEEAVEDDETNKIEPAKGMQWI